MLYYYISLPINLQNFFPGSPYRSLISSEILKLQEDGVLHMLKEKWWKDAGRCKDDDKKPTSASELGLPNVGGVFVVLLAGLGMAAIVAVFEFIWRTKKIPRDERVSCWVIICRRKRLQDHLKFYYKILLIERSSFRTRY